MTRLYGTGDDGLDDDTVTEHKARQLAALVPRPGRQRHKTEPGESTDPLIPPGEQDHIVGQLPTEWRTTS